MAVREALLINFSEVPILMTLSDLKI